ncbi:gfo/Idh/MocA family oxidoreductase [Clostridiales bacterium COT073_COT-073]|nr:gfo/Idh/MocA family oxidoreductase [Clostridiales bacterium COT073_COT-073]
MEEKYRIKKEKFMVRMGVVGTGFHIGIAKMHISAYLRMPNVSVVALYDVDKEKAEKYKTEFDLKDTEICDSYEQLLSLVDAVTICTPNAFHVELAFRALEQGKHVLCEKPLGTSAGECDKLVEKAEKSNLVCGVGLCYRFIPGYQLMKKIIEEGALGEIYYLRAEMGGNRIADPSVELEWRMREELSGAGSIADFGSHLLDLSDIMLSADRGKITEIQAIANTFITQRKDEITKEEKKVSNEDVGMILAKTEKGTLISLSTSRVGSKHTMEIVGAGGFLEFDGSHPEQLTVMLKDKNGGYSQPPEVIKVPLEMYQVDAYGPKQGFEVNFYLQNKAFVEAITGQKMMVAPIRRGQYIQSLIDAAKLSAQTGQKIRMEEIV